MRPANVSTSPTEGVRCHAVDPAAKLEKLERDSNKSLQLLKKQLEEMAKKQDETIIELQQKIAQKQKKVFCSSMSCVTNLKVIACLTS